MRDKGCNKAGREKWNCREAGEFFSGPDRLPNSRGHAYTGPDTAGENPQNSRDDNQIIKMRRLGP